MKVVLLAASSLAQPLFQAMVQGGHAAGLVTSPRGAASGLEHWAQSSGVPMFVADRAFTGVESWLARLQPDCLLTFTFPYRLPPGVLEAPRLGCFNFHGGRLPEYRGSQPIFWQIARGESHGALTVHRMTEEFDQGPVVAVAPLAIAPEETYGLHALRIAHAAVPLGQSFVSELERLGSDLLETAQDETRARLYPRPTQSDLVIRWNDLDGSGVRALVKAGNPWNHGALTTIRGVPMRLTDVTLLADAGSTQEAGGVILRSNFASGVVVNCRDGSALRLDIVSMEEGILPGGSLATLGIRAGEQFTSPVV